MQKTKNAGHKTKYKQITKSRTFETHLVIEKSFLPHDHFVLFAIFLTLQPQLLNQRIPLAFLIETGQHLFPFAFDILAGVSEVFVGLVVVILRGADCGFEACSERSTLFADLKYLFFRVTFVCFLFVFVMVCYRVCVCVFKSCCLIW